MSIAFDQFMEQTDSILTANGLYVPVTYVDTTVDDLSYDPVTGEYVQSSSTTHSFNAVSLTQTASNEPNNQYSVTLDIIVVARNITFTPEIDQIYDVNGTQWQVVTASLAPQGTIHSISLGRK